MPHSSPKHHAPALPGPRASQVWIDFDGTITRRDVLDDLIERYAADDSWKEVERQWQSGQIGSRRCLEAEFALLRLTDAELERFLDTVQLDPGLESLLKLLDRHDVPRAIVSDGIDQFILRILRRHGVSDITIRSNALRRRGDGFDLVCPWSSGACESAAAHCKCSSIRALASPTRRSIYVGDGRSDLCPARKADVVFAKGALAAALAAEGRAFIPFSTLGDVGRFLEDAWNRSEAFRKSEESV